jgi:hypothetical protein
MPIILSYPEHKNPCFQTIKLNENVSFASEVIEGRGGSVGDKHMNTHDICIGSVRQAVNG